MGLENLYLLCISVIFAISIALESRTLPLARRTSVNLCMFASHRVNCNFKIRFLTVYSDSTELQSSSKYLQCLNTEKTKCKFDTIITLVE